MITASELGMLCARHRIKSASWLTEGVRSWFTPKPPAKPKSIPPEYRPPEPGPAHPDKGYTHAVRNPYSSIEEPAARKKGITAGFYFFPYPDGKRPLRDNEYPPAGKEPDFLQPPKQPKFDYLNPPGDNTRTKISPRNFVEPIYAKYPGGLDQAIQDSQRWQNEAQLAGLPTWTPEALSKEVPVYTGKYVGERETPSTPHSPNSFAHRSLGGYFSPSTQHLAMNFPAYSKNKDLAEYTSSLGHELTHATHHAETNKWPSRVNVFPPNFMEAKEQRYIGDPTEYAARISEARRDWLQHHPGKRISTVQEGSNVLDDIYAAHNAEPTKFIVPRSKYPTMTRKDKEKGFPNYLNPHVDTLIKWQEKIPKGAPADPPSRAALLEPKAPVPRHVQYAKEEIDRLPKLIGRDVLHEDEIIVPPRKLPYDLRFPLEKIMADPELRRRAILQILSSVVQNKQRQAPGTNV
jgi:hypothetical protein